jgi:hypothetical protein
VGASFYGELLIRISADNKQASAVLADSAAKTKAFGSTVAAQSKAAGASTSVSTWGCRTSGAR